MAKGRFKPQIDMIAVTWIVIAVLVFLYISTYVDLDIGVSSKGQIGFSMLIAGAFFPFITSFDPRPYIFDMWLSKEEVATFLSFVMVSVAMVFVINYLTLETLPLSVQPTTRSLFVMQMGIAEEMLFRNWFLSWILLVTGGDAIIAVLFSSVAGATFHAAIYGLSPTLIFIVFACFVVMGTAYVLTNRRISVTMTAHGLVNLAAVIAGG